MGAQVSTQKSGSHENQNILTNGSHQTFTVINYYKDAASSSSAGQSLSMDPSKFTEPVKDLMLKGAPALNSPNVEACGYSDRVQQITLGNSTITTQEAANAVVCYAEWPEYLSDNDASDVNKTSKPDTSVCRFYTLDSKDWSPSSKGWCWKLPDALKDMGVFGQNMFFHSLGRTGYTIHVQCNATKFHSGCLLVVVIPEHQLASHDGGSVSVKYKYTHPGDQGIDLGTTEENFGPAKDAVYSMDGTLLGNLTIFPHQFINLRTNNTATIVVPYINSVPIDSMTRHNNVSLMVIPIVPLMAPTGNATTLPITVTIAPMCTEFSGIRSKTIVPNATPQGLPTTTLPGSGQFLTTDDRQSPSALPNYEPTPRIHIPGQVKNLLEIIQVDTLIPMNNTKTKDEVDSYLIPLTQGLKNAQIFGTNLYIGDGVFKTTLLGEIVQYYAHWSGSLRISLMYTGPALSSAKLTLAYTPPGAQGPTSRKEAMLGTHVVWDIGLQSTIVMTIPWTSGVQFRYTDKDTYTSAGFLSCWYQTSLILPPQTAGTVYLLSFISACPDFKLRLMKDTQTISQTTALTEGLNDELEEVIVEKTKQTLASITSGPKHTQSVPTLTANETGATMPTQPSDNVETRTTYMHFNGSETDVENFLGRAACVHMVEIVNKNPEGLENQKEHKLFNDWRINLSSLVQLRKKLELFTYVRFDSEYTILATASQPTSSKYSSSLTVQAMYVPPGAPNPTKWDDYTWQSASNPSVFFKVGDTARFSVPFVGLASAYNCFYDGYSHDDEDTPYGITVLNHMGSMAFRIVNEHDAHTTEVKIRVYHRAKHVEAWIPRAPRALPYVSIGRTNYNKQAIVPVIKKRSLITNYGIGPRFGGVFTGNVKIMNYHLMTPEDHLNLVAPHPNRDLAVVSTGAHGAETIPHCNCTSGVYYSTYYRKFYPIICGKPTTIWIEGGPYYPSRYQVGVMKGVGPAEPGDCGGILRCVHGPIGLLTAGGSGYVCFADIRQLDCIAEEQGLGDYITSLGRAFGVGFTDQISAKVTELQDVAKDFLTTKVLSKVVKMISALVIICRNHDDLVTVTATLALLGCDGSPWRFLKMYISKHFQVPYIERQANDGWFRKFNDACNAAKGLEWIANKISKLIEWIKNKVLPQAKEKLDFCSKLKQLDMLERQITTMHVSNPTQEKREQLFNNVMWLEQMSQKFAPLYAAEAKRIRELKNKILNYMQFKNKQRTEPVCVLIHGTPGSGKSLTTSIVGRALAEHLNSAVYSLPPDPKHFDGYQQQEVVIMDDLNQNPDGQDISMFCQMVSSVDFIPPMASLDNKGMLFTSNFVLASTNSNTLSPPTILNPEALARRFGFDLDICLHSTYTKNGKLNAAMVTTICKDCHQPTNFKKCCPLVCGKAISLVDRATNIRYSVDQLVSAIINDYRNKIKITDSLEALFQGPVYKDLEIDVCNTPAPECINDLLKSVDSEEVREYCKKKNWIIPQIPTNIERAVNQASMIINTILMFVSTLGIVYVIYKLFAQTQGPYSGNPAHNKLKAPTLRPIVVQGPNTEFALSLLRKNIVTITTEKGEFTGLGVYDHVCVVPTHAQPSESVLLNGQKVHLKDKYKLVDPENVNLELTIIVLDRNEKFRDIRGFISEDAEGLDASLVIHSNNYTNTILDVGPITMAGLINLSSTPTNRMIRYDYPTRTGQCGGVLCTTGKIFGIHVGGNGRQGFSAQLRKQYFVAKQGQVVTRQKLRELNLAPVNTPTKTKLHPSVFYDVFPGNKQPAVLSDNDPRLEVKLTESLFSKYKGNVEMKPTENMLVAVDHYAGQLLSLDIPTDELSLKEALYGVDGLEPIDITTSAGYPYVSLGIKKRDILNKETQETEKMKFYLDKYGIDLPLVTYIKDELRSADKVRLGKSRLIEASSLNDSVNMRMKLGHLYKTFHQNPGVITGSAVGCDPDVFWSVIPCLMDGHLMAFDYSNFDASLSPVWFECLERVLSKIGFKCASLIQTICNTHHIFRDEIYTVKGGMPSGCSGTSIFNSMINNIIIRTLVLDAYKGIDLDKLKVIAYGDDLIVSYPFELDPGVLANLGKNYGLTITPPDKSEKFVKMTWENLTFLKRYFRPDEQFPFLIHPVMPMQDIHESIRWTKDPRNTQDHVRSLCMLAWHSGQKEYDEFLSKIRTTDIGKCLNLPEYSVLRKRWLDMF
ncbi:polyprotein [rhinovirus B92]|uniref:Genome polyprotein n=27 Tax=Enterovirus TaxID=12059 RepID=B9V490_9ENTO|nr:polyprotein [rhinovirus B92]